MSSKIFSRKSQVAAEFIILAGFLFVIFVFLIILITDRTIAMHEERRQRTLEEVGWIIESEIDLARNVKSGYERTFELPKIIDGHNYNILLKIGTEVNEMELSYVPELAFEEKHVIFIPKTIDASNTQPGFNKIIKENNQIVITHLP